MRPFILAFSALFPWPLRRRILQGLLRYSLHPSCHISRLSFVLPRKLVMGSHSRIGALTVCKGLTLLEIGDYASIGRLNLITGFPEGRSKHFSLQFDRHPQLIVGMHAAITNQHIIDCTDTVRIGAYATFAGFRSQILTHAIDLTANMQKCAPVTIGDYAFVGTDTVILAGSALPSRSILAAKSLLNKQYEVEDYVYGGVPARPIGPREENAIYFSRTEGFVW
jgi:acetyltransferase-like isoleucine patch superfamily enzyme